MQYTIENDQFKVAVRHKGVELCSIQSKKTGTEYMWDAAADVWGSHAPVLFPVIGQVRPQGHTINGERFYLPRHGFIRNNENLNVEVKADAIVCQLVANSETRKVYPFEFLFEVCYRLQGNKLFVEHTIENKGYRDMFYSLGGHPAFRCPWNEGEQYTDYLLEFEQIETSDIWQVREDGLVGKETRPFFEGTNLLPLDKGLFENDALVFKDLKSKEIALKNKHSKQSLSVRFDGFPYMGIWAKYGADFICIEPWLGIADSVDAADEFSEKEGVITLASGEKNTATYVIEINE